MEADDHAGDQAEDRGRTTASRGSDDDAHDRAAGARGEAGRQVDLAEEQHEDEAHRQDVTAAPWLIRLAKLSAVVKVSGRMTENTMSSAIRPGLRAVSRRPRHGPCQ